MVEQDSAPSLRVYGPHTRQVARLLRHQPALGGRLLCAPRRAIHAIGVYLHVVGPAPDEDLARRLIESSPRDLLRAALPLTPPALFRLLDRCGDVVRRRNFYEDLAKASVGPFAKMLFDTQRPIDEPLLRHIATLAEEDDVIRALPTRVLTDASMTRAVASLVAVLRGHGADVDSAFAGFSARSSTEGVRRRILKVLGDLIAPPLPASLPSGLRWVNSVRELREIGGKLDLCVRAATHGGADYWLRLVDGSSVFTVLEEPLALVELRAVAPDVWLLTDVRERGNGLLSPARRRGLVAALVEAGWRLVPVDPVSALLTLGTREDDEFASWDRTLADALREMDHEWS